MSENDEVATKKMTVNSCTVAILQSNYIPWKGYFDIIHDADIFIFYDDLQFTKNDWRNRNKIKTAQGSKWLSIPVGTSASCPNANVATVRLPSQPRISNGWHWYRPVC